MSPTFKFRDNSRIKDFRSCPTLHYYSYKLGLKITAPQMPLIFGTSWHASMDSVYHNFNTIRESMFANDKNTTREQVAEAVHKIAFKAFCDSWEEQGMETGTVLGKSARNTIVASEVIYNYIIHNYHFLEQHKVVSIERPFIIPINNNDSSRMYVGRVDKCVQNMYSGRYSYVEHKTTSQYSTKFGIQPDTVDEYNINTQVEGYYLNGKSKYGEEFESVKLDFALVYNSRNDVFQRVDHRRNSAELDQFLKETNYWWDRIDEAEEKDFFPRNPGYCIHKYGRCNYFNICAKYPDHKKVHDLVKSDNATLSGFKIEFWEPFSFKQLEEILKDETKQPEQPTQEQQ